jgi:hypothetical protein
VRRRTWGRTARAGAITCRASRRQNVDARRAAGGRLDGPPRVASVLAVAWLVVVAGAESNAGVPFPRWMALAGTGIVLLGWWLLRFVVAAVTRRASRRPLRAGAQQQAGRRSRHRSPRPRSHRSPGLACSPARRMDHRRSGRSRPRPPGTVRSRRAAGVCLSLHDTLHGAGPGRSRAPRDPKGPERSWPRSVLPRVFLRGCARNASRNAWWRLPERHRARFSGRDGWNSGEAVTYLASAAAVSRQTPGRLRARLRFPVANCTVRAPASVPRRGADRCHAGQLA